MTNDNQQDAPRRRTPRSLKTAAKVVKWLWLAGCIVCSLVMLVAAYGGVFNPAWSTIPAILAMVFPLWFVADMVTAVINIWVKKWVAVWQLLTLVLAFPGFWAFCPLNFTHPYLGPENEAEQLKFVSYNTYGFIDNEGIYPNSLNRTASQFIRFDADIICVQEMGYISDLKDRHLYKEQIDSINDRFPYVVYNDEKQVSILSRYPLSEIDLPQPGHGFEGWSVAEVYRGSDTILVVSVHLASIGLNNEDKEIYHKMTEADEDVNWRGAVRYFYGKLRNAFAKRADECAMLRHQIDSIGYRNIIIAGDFNDIEGCYGQRILMGDNLRSAFTHAALGPMITYNSDRFFFNIDHVLYGGDLVAARFSRGNIPSSDHYPLMVTFLLPDKGE